MPERIQKIIANSGCCSRRKAEELIADGKVTVNGKVAKIGESAEPADKILVEGRPLAKPKPAYAILNKPAGYETTLKSTRDAPAVVELVNEKQRLIPVGRLDMDSRGLLLLTNDGELAHRVMHPRYPIDKVYRVAARGSVSETDIGRLRVGIELEDGRTLPCEVRLVSRTPQQTILRITLHEGRKRQIRRMLAAVGSEVTDLVRVAIGPLSLEGLKEGTWRRLTDDEVRALKNAVGL